MNALYLVDAENAALLRFIRNAPDVRTEEDFRGWCRDDLKKLIPFQMMLCAVGRLFGDLIVVDTIQGIDYPPGFIEQLARRINLADRFVIQRWLKTRDPQLIDPNNYREHLSQVELEEYEHNKLRNIAAHGVIDPDGQRASYFSFSRLDEPLSERMEMKLRMVVPHLHHARCEIAWKALRETAGVHQPSQLSPRELEVLRWVLRGKTNVQIASVLERSPETIKNQVRSILTKLNADNRAQAVTRAMELGIVERAAPASIPVPI